MITTILICSCCYCTDIWSSKHINKDGKDVPCNNNEEDDNEELESVSNESYVKKSSHALCNEHNCYKHLNSVTFQFPTTTSSNTSPSNGYSYNSGTNGTVNCIHNYNKINDFNKGMDNCSNNIWKHPHNDLSFQNNLPPSCGGINGGGGGKTNNNIKCNSTSTCYSNCSRNSHTLSSSIVTTPNTNQPPTRSPSPTTNHISQNNNNLLPAVILPIPCFLQTHSPQLCHGIDCIYATKDYIQLGKMKSEDDIGVSAV
uniref:Uncharacterized protein n=1 Tax=Parastrongyloides trichosuri TaxID=131310 RepID=A0A0N4ZPT8_PARTI